MAVQDLWRGSDGKPTARNGRGRRWRVVVPGHPSRAFATKADAVEWERRLWQDQPRPGGSMTIGACLDIYMAGRRHLSPGYTSSLRGAAGHVRDHWGDTQASQVTTSGIQAWLAGLQAQHGPRLPDGGRSLQPMAQQSRARILQVLRGSLEVAREHGVIDTNPAERATAGRPQRRMPMYLTVPELRELAAAAGSYQPMVWLLGTTGVRIGECCRLGVDDVDVRRSRLAVRKAKSGRGREVPIPAAVLAMLDLTRPGPLFRSPSGERVDPGNWRHRVFAPAKTAIGKPGLHIHDLRHTAASLMVASGASVKDVQAALGHASAAMTLNVYAHLFDGSLDDVGERMGRLLGDL